MKKLIIFIVSAILFLGLNVFAQDMYIDSNGNVGIGTTNPTARVEVEAVPDSDGVVGYSSGAGIGIYGENNTSGNFGLLGGPGYGVYGYNGNGYAGYFQGDARVTGTLTIDGLLTGQGIADITEIVPGTGLTGGGTSGSITIDVNFNGTGSADAAARSDHNHDAAYSLSIHNHTGADITSGTLQEVYIDPLIARDSEIMPQVLSLDGSGSGLNADELDGQDSSSFADTETVNSLEARVTSIEDQMGGMPGPLVYSIIKSASLVSTPTSYGASELERWIRAAQKAGTIQGSSTELDTNGDGVVTQGADYTNNDLAANGVTAVFVDVRSNIMGETSPWDSSLPLWIPTPAVNNQTDCDVYATANTGQITLCENASVTAIFVSAADDAGNIVYRKSVHGVTEQERINSIIKTATESVPELEAWLRASQHGGMFNPLALLREVDTDGNGIIDNSDLTNLFFMTIPPTDQFAAMRNYLMEQVSPWDSEYFLWQPLWQVNSQQECDSYANNYHGQITLCYMRNYYNVVANFFISATDGNGTVIYRKTIQGISKREKIDLFLDRLADVLPILEKWIAAGRKAGTAEGLLNEVDTNGDGIVDDADYTNDILAASGILSAFTFLHNNYIVEGSPLTDYTLSLWAPAVHAVTSKNDCDNIALQQSNQISLCYYPAEDETIETVFVAVADETLTVFYRKTIAAN